MMTLANIFKHEKAFDKEITVAFALQFGCGYVGNNDSTGETRWADLRPNPISYMMVYQFNNVQMILYFLWIIVSRRPGT